MAKKKSKKPASKAASKPAPKKHLSRADRAKILAEAKSKGWTAEQIAKRAGVSKWTVYGWNKRSAKRGATGSARRDRKPGRPSSRVPAGLPADFREMITGIVREEIGRLLGGK